MSLPLIRQSISFICQVLHMLDDLMALNHVGLFLLKIDCYCMLLVVPNLPILLDRNSCYVCMVDLRHYVLQCQHFEN